jgi:hypothetical protein
MLPITRSSYRQLKHRCASLIIAGWALLLPSLSAQTELPAVSQTWTGNALFNDGWNNAGNWLGGQSPNTGGDKILYFGHAELYTAGNDIAGSFAIRNIIFGEDAEESYTLYGESLNLGVGGGSNATKGIIQNRSQYMQRIENNFFFVSSPSTQVIFETGAAGMDWSGSVEADPGAGTFTLIKRGSGELYIRGNMVMEEPDPENPEGVKQFNWRVDEGTLVLDASSPNFGTNASISLADRGNLRVIGNTTGQTTLELGEFASLSRNRLYTISVDSNGGDGTRVNFAQWLSGHSAAPGSSTTARYGASLLLDLNTPNSEVNFDSYQNQSSSHFALGLIRNVYVKQGGVTGYAEVVGADLEGKGGRVVRYQDFTPLAASGNNNTTHYSITGDLELTANASLGSLTIQGGGVLSSTGPTTSLGLVGSVGGILMEEGSTDFTIEVPYLNYSNNNTIRIANFSTDGNLTIASALGSTSLWVNATIAMSIFGPGKVRLTGDPQIGDPNDPTLPKGFTTATGTKSVIYVAGGHLEINTTGTSTLGLIEVMDGVLSGNGQIGGGINWISGSQHDGLKYASVKILDDAVLDASNGADSALDIHGTLSLHATSTYRMTLEANREAALSVTRNPVLTAEETVVTLAGDLALDLNYAPALWEWILLLTSDGGISGTFSSINGEAFLQAQDFPDLTGEDPVFTLDFNSQSYLFRIDYNYELGGDLTAVAIQAVPEPATVALLAGTIGLLVILRVRRRR